MYLTLLGIIGFVFAFVGAFSDGMDEGFRWCLVIAGCIIMGLCVMHSNKNKPEKRFYNH